MRKRNYAYVVAQEILEGDLSYENGLELLCGVNIALDYPDDLGEFTALQDEWYYSHLYGLTKKQRNMAVVTACKELVGVIAKPELIMA